MARILVLDDEQSIRRAMAWELKGNEVVSAATMGEAVLALSRYQFDAVICDWQLGTETSEAVLRVAAKLNTGAKRFIVSGQVPDELAPLIISGVVHRFIAKPWSPHDVRDAIAEVLGG